MNGDGNYSYAQNSSYQRGAVDTKELIKEGVASKLDLKLLSSSSTINPFRIADFGCSRGPNTLLAMQIILEVVVQKFKSEKPTTELIPEFQVFFSDQVLNDFNTLFQSLPPKRRYHAAGVAGSFYDRLFPTASLHFAFSSFSPSWISDLPEEILDSKSPTWNKGRIHYT